MTRIEFRGFGRNWQTLLLVIVMASLLSGAFTLVRPVVMPGSRGEDTALGATPPCNPYPAREKSVSNSHGGFGWGITITARVRYNGCDIYVISGSQDCYWWAVGYSIQQLNCTNYRTGTTTAYAENLHIWGRFNVYVGWQGFPISASPFMCRNYDRNANIISTYNGPYYHDCYGG